AKHFPSVEFLFLGQAYHGDHEVVWHPRDLPSNVRLMGHVDGEEKTRILSSAWALINTSIHEGLAVSFLEALTCETPLLSCIDTEEVASRFGIYVGSFTGTGMDSVPAFVKGLRELIDAPDRRRRLGKDGRDWVAKTHNRERFLDAFHDLCVSARAL
ncbi:MAG: glycosyltransferase family 4 protein, partial [Acidobacteria bacterium]|nr:glycosyltransferase family 4 protein [Acidobacteriota bacterium]